MYSVSQDYLDALDLPVRTYKLAGTVGGVSFDESNILSIEISNQVSEGSEIKLGSVYIGELTASFYGVTGIARGSWVGKTIVLSEGLMLEDNSFEYVPLGVFTIAEANHTQEGVDVVAYDAMTAFDKARNDLTETGTAYDFLSLMCQKCGVTLGMTSADVAALTNGTETLSIYSENDIETWRDLLSWVAQTLCSVATINRAGELELRQYSVSSAATIDETHRFTGCSFSDFTTYYTGMSVVNIALRQTEYKSVTPDDGLTYNLGSNPLVQGDYELVQNIIDEFSNVQLVPFSAQMLGGAIYDLCDCLTFSGGIAAGAVCGVMGYTWKYNGAYAVNGFGSNPALATAKSKAQKDIDAIYNTIGEEINQMSVVQNSSSVTCGENTETSILTYNFEVTQEENTTMVDVSVVMTSSATETEVGDVYTLSDIVAHLSFYVDGSEVSVYSPEFIVDEGKDTMTFNYSLSGLSVGAHEFDVRLEMDGGSGSIAVGDVHEMLWGYGITFEVYVKSVEIDTSHAQTVYYPGQNLYYWGVSVKAVYSNGLQSDVTADATFDPAIGTPVTEDDIGTHTVYVEYDEYGGSFEIIVSDISLNLDTNQSSGHYAACPEILLEDGSARYFVGGARTYIYYCTYDENNNYKPLCQRAEDYAPVYAYAPATQDENLVIHGKWVYGDPQLVANSTPKNRAVYDFATSTMTTVTPVIDFVGHASASVAGMLCQRNFVVDDHIIYAWLEIDYYEDSEFHNDAQGYGIGDLTNGVYTIHIYLTGEYLPLVYSMGNTAFTLGKYMAPVLKTSNFCKIDIADFNQTRYLAKYDGTNVTLARMSVSNAHVLSITDLVSIPFDYTPNLLRVNYDKNLLVFGYSDATVIDMYFVNTNDLSYERMTSDDPANNDFYNYVVGERVMYHSGLNQYMRMKHDTFSFKQTVYISGDLLHWDSVEISPMSGGGSTYKFGTDISPDPLGFWATGRRNTDSGYQAVQFTICYALGE